MTQTIQYAKTSDGVSIAYSVIGSGTPIVLVPQWPWSNIQAEWGVAPMRHLYTDLAREVQVVRYDGRGTGSSDRRACDPSLDAMVRDLQAVVQRLGLSRFALVGPTLGGPIAIAYAGLFPAQVSHLALWCTSARVNDVYPQGSEPMDQMAATDWQFMTESIAHAALNWTRPELAREMAALLRTCVDPDLLVAAMPVQRAQDATQYLGRITARTLVVTRNALQFIGADVSRSLAAAIPDSRLVVLEGSTVMPIGDNESLLEVLLAFLDEEPPVPTSGDHPQNLTDTANAASLTPREAEVLALLAGGHTAKEMADRLTVSVSTVQRHIANIYAKIGARGRVEAAAYAHERGILQRRSD